MFEKNIPRDFFLHAGAFVALYLGAIALITLLFNVINYAFPDVLQGVSYGDPYSGPMRFAIASLFVLVPLTVYLFFRIQSETRKNPERRSLGVRKWLTYITLFIAGATAIGDLIMLMDSFLGGTLPTAFLLKVLVILGVMGAGFGYFFFDIKGYWVTHAAQSRSVGLGICIVVFGSIVGGMMLIGSPVTQRELSLDNQQINDLMSIEYAVNTYWQATNGTLPDKLNELENDVTGFRVPQSPADRTPYAYNKTSTTTYELCATFALPLEKTPSPAFEYTYPQGLWSHAAGFVCFPLKMDPALLDSQKNAFMGTVPMPVKGY